MRLVRERGRERNVSIHSINKGTESKYRNDPIDRPSKYRMCKRTFKSLTPTQAKRSPDYSASQEYMNRHKVRTFNKGHFSSI